VFDPVRAERGQRGIEGFLGLRAVHGRDQG
jgi:hypothetical protein